MNKTTQILMVASLLAVALVAIWPTTGAAQCAIPGQAVTAYYPANAPCATGACAPVVVDAYRPAYQPLFTGATSRRYDRLMQRWNRFWSRNEPVAINQPVAMTAAYGSADLGSCTTCYKPQQCCRYVPQTCYRTVYTNVPVTTYRPVSSCDPCTGCVTTCMKPCTTYQRQAQSVPYTTYRMVCETRYTPVTSCTPACTTGCDMCSCPTGSCTTGSCATGGCVTGNCVTGNCATGNCATGNCATGNNQAIVGQPTARPTLSPPPVETNKPAASNEVEIEITPEVEIQPMRDLDHRDRPTLESDHFGEDKMAALDVTSPRVRRVSVAQPVVGASHDGGWRASNR